jgi:hypothetical protein
MLMVMIIISTALTALVSCFIFGVYENYEAKILEGETDARTITVKADHSVGIQTEHLDLINTTAPEAEAYYSSINKKEVVDMLTSLPEAVQNQIDNVFTFAMLDDSVYALNRYHFFFKPVGDKIYPCYVDATQFTDEEYSSEKKIARVDENLYDPIYSCGISSPYFTSDSSKTLDENTKFITVNGEEFEIIGMCEGGNTEGLIYINFMGLDDDTPLDSDVSIELNEKVTYSTYNIIKNAVDEYMAGNAYVEDLHLSAATDIAYYKTIIWITVAVAFLFAINLAVLYKYIVECNKRRIVIMRICGCKRSRSIRLFLTQALMIIAPVFALLEYAFHKLIYPNILDFFPNMINSFSLSVYIVMFVGYVVVSGAVLYAMLRRNIGKKLNFTEAAV